MNIPVGMVTCLHKSQKLLNLHYAPFQSFFYFIPWIGHDYKKML